MHHAGAGGGIGFGGNADIPTVEGVVVMGISVPRTEERLLRKVMRLSMAISACYLVYLCGSVVEYLHPDNNTSSSQWMGLAVFILVCGVGVPLSGYLGAKTRARAEAATQHDEARRDAAQPDATPEEPLVFYGPAPRSRADEARARIAAAHEAARALREAQPEKAPLSTRYGSRCPVP